MKQKKKLNQNFIFETGKRKSFCLSYFVKLKQIVSAMYYLVIVNKSTAQKFFELFILIVTYRF